MKRTKAVSLFLCGCLSLNLVACSEKSSSTNQETKTKSEQKNETKGQQPTNTISLEQFSKLKTDMTYEEVKNIIGCDGDQVGSVGEKGDPNYQVRYGWKGKAPNSGAIITFMDGKLRSKTQDGLQ
ncbi:hypothetical protein ACFDTO_37105 [Microbacteriaceae bacterium 4G12]